MFDWNETQRQNQTYERARAYGKSQSQKKSLTMTRVKNAVDHHLAFFKKQPVSLLMSQHSWDLMTNEHVETRGRDSVRFEMEDGRPALTATRREGMNPFSLFTISSGKKPLLPKDWIDKYTTEAVILD
jgi:hypothetical protein